MDRRSFLKGLSATALYSAYAFSQPTRALAGLNQKIIVIGAGMSGVAAANKLAAHGCQVTVLEGRNRLGGRTHTDNILGASIDMGAAWIEGINGNPLMDLVSQYNVQTVPDTADYPLFGNRNRLMRARPVRRVQQIFNDILERAYYAGQELNRDRSVGAMMNREIRQLRRNGTLNRRDMRIMRYLINATITGDAAVDPKYMSIWYAGDDDGFGGDSHLIPGGYIQLVDGLAQNLDIRTDHIVQRIEYNSAGVTVRTSEGDFTADKVVITLPLGVLKKGVVDFDPVLPSEKRDAISRLDMGLLNKVIMRFPNAFWQVDGYQLSGFGHTRLGGRTPTEIGDFIDMATVTGEPILLGIFGGDFAKWTEQLSKDELVNLAMTSLRRIFGDNIPAPIAATRTQWMSDPFTYGAYSYIPVGAYGEDRDTLAEPVANRLFFAGEASNRQYPATVHGAYLSGIREADRILGFA